MAAGCSLATALVAQSGNTATAKQDSAPDVPLFKLEVRRVPVDVVVTDKHGNPVKGLKESDFIVKEDNKPQKVLSFDVVNGNVADYVPPKVPPLPVNTYLNVPSAPERGPLYVLYYDMVNTLPEDQMYFRKELLDFVDHAPPGIRIAIFVNAMHLELVQGFTSDREVLKAAILAKGPGPHIPLVFTFGRNLGRNDVGGVLSNMNFMAQYLAGIPGRKNLIWLSSRFPIPVAPTVFAGNGGGRIPMAGQAPPSMAVGHMGGPDVLDLTDLVWQMVHRTYAAMMRAQMALYPVDLHGVGGASTYAAEGDAMVDHQYMDDIAASTGGRAYYNNNHLGEMLVKAIDDGSTYYSLSYEPPSANFAATKEDNQQREIEVSLKNMKKGEYTLRYRTTYFAVPNDTVQADKMTTALQARFMAAKEKDTLYASIEHGAPTMHDLLFAAHLSAEGSPVMATEDQMVQLEDSPLYFKTRKPNQKVKPPKPVKLQKYVIDYEVIDPHLKALSLHGGQPPVLEFAAAAYDMDGRLLNSMLNRGTPSGEKGPQAKTDALFNAVQELEAPPGTAFIRMAVRDTLNDRTGTMEVRLPLKAESDVAEAGAKN